MQSHHTTHNIFLVLKIVTDLRIWLENEVEFYDGRRLTLHNIPQVLPSPSSSPSPGLSVLFFLFCRHNRHGAFVLVSARRQ